jgi:hypothetical protein
MLLPARRLRRLTSFTTVGSRSIVVRMMRDYRAAHQMKSTEPRLSQ